MGKNILTEAELRSGSVKREGNKVFVSPDTFITELAAEYIRTHALELVKTNTIPSESKGGSFGKGVMSYSPIASTGTDRFVDYRTGRTYSEKPEHMTHLRGNLLVPKTDARILFRGKLDSLEALIMQTQITAEECGYPQIAKELDEVMSFVQHILASEVKDEPLPEISIFGMDSAALRYASHHLKEVFGIDHSVPHYSMGKVCVALNTLRAFVRETELAAATAFTEGAVVTRTDIIEALNRLSSCVYIIFCKKVSGKYD